MVVLADIVAWYQPRAIEDPETGAILRYERKFDGDRLQVYSSYFEDKFGMSEKQVRVALDRLIAMGVVTRTVEERVTVVRQGAQTILYNVPYVDLNAAALARISLPREWQEEGGVCPTGHRGMSYRTQGYALYGIHTDLTDTVLSIPPENGNADKIDPYFGKTPQDVFGKRPAQIAAEQNKLLVESMELPWAQWHAIVACLADVHGLKVAIEEMGDDRSLQKMQDLTNKLARVHVDTEGKIQALYQSWLKYTPLGKKAAKGNKRPMGSNLSDHASDLISKGMMKNGTISGTQMDSAPSGTDTQCDGDIDYTELAESNELLPEVQFRDDE